MAEVIDDSGVQVDYRIRQGDGWPREPLTILVLDPDGDPIPGSIVSARCQVRASYDATATLADVDSADVGSALTVAVDGSSVTLGEGAVPATDDWPTVDPDLGEREWARCPWDLEITTGAGFPDTTIAGHIAVLPQVTHD